MHRPAARWARLKSFFNPLYHPRHLRRAEAFAAALLVSVGLPIAGLWEIRENPGWFGISRACIHEGIPLLLLAAFMGAALPDVGLPRRQSLLVLVPFLSLPVVVQAFWRAASLPDRYWARRW
jgi:hypothetical protein